MSHMARQAAPVAYGQVPRGGHSRGGAGRGSGHAGGQDAYSAGPTGRGGGPRPSGRGGYQQYNDQSGGYSRGRGRGGFGGGYHEDYYAASGPAYQGGADTGTGTGYRGHARGGFTASNRGGGHSGSTYPQRGGATGFSSSRFEEPYGGHAPRGPFPQQDRGRGRGRGGWNDAGGRDMRGYAPVDSSGYGPGDVSAYGGASGYGGHAAPRRQFGDGATGGWDAAPAPRRGFTDRRDTYMGHQDTGMIDSYAPPHGGGRGSSRGPPRRKPCHFFFTPRGCNKGDACPYSHEDAGGAGGYSAPFSGDTDMSMGAPTGGAPMWMNNRYGDSGGQDTWQKPQTVQADDLFADISAEVADSGIEEYPGMPGAGPADDGPAALTQAAFELFICPEGGVASTEELEYRKLDMGRFSTDCKLDHMVIRTGARPVAQPAFSAEFEYRRIPEEVPAPEYCFADECLYVAVLSGDAEAAKAAITNGADVNVQGVLMPIAAGSASDGKLVVIGAAPSITGIEGSSIQGAIKVSNELPGKLKLQSSLVTTPLRLCQQLGHHELAKLLSAAGAR